MSLDRLYAGLAETHLFLGSCGWVVGQDILDKPEDIKRLRELLEHLKRQIELFLESAKGYPNASSPNAT